MNKLKKMINKIYKILQKLINKIKSFIYLYLNYNLVALRQELAQTYANYSLLVYSKGIFISLLLLWVDHQMLLSKAMIVYVVKALNIIYAQIKIEMQNYQMNKQTAQRRQQSILRSKNILFAIYIIHSILIAVYSTYILIKYHDVPSPTITFIMILVYGYMIVWVLIVNFLFILCQKQQKAVCFTRIFVKIVFFLFPIFGLLSISKDEQLNKKQIHIFIIYMGVITFLLIIYEIITCSCYEHKQPEFLFQKNDLKQANDLILQKRNQYNQMIKKQ